MTSSNDDRSPKVEDKEKLHNEILRRESVERQLAASEAKYRDLYDNAPDMYVSVCPQTRKVLQCNKNLLNVLGYSEHEVLGHDLFKLYHADCLPEVVIAFRQFLETGEVPESELQLAKRDGTPLDVSLRVSAVRDEQGCIVSSRSAWRDISHRKKIERMLAARHAELSHVTRLATMGEMAGGLAHELNQPLQAITNFADGCVTRLESGQDLDRAALLEVALEVASQARRAGQIIQRLKRMVERREHVRETVNVNDLIREAIGLLGAELKQNSVQWEHSGDQEILVVADSVQIEQAIINLVRNAIASLSESNAVPRTVRMSTEQVGNKAHICIADTGKGIPPAELPLIFDAFHSNSKSAMGLGLAITRTIIESHGGSIRAVNNPDCGVSFHFTLPLA